MPARRGTTAPGTAVPKCHVGGGGGGDAGEKYSGINIWAGRASHAIQRHTKGLLPTKRSCPPSHPATQPPTHRGVAVDPKLGWVALPAGVLLGVQAAVLELVQALQWRQSTPGSTRGTHFLGTSQGSWAMCASLLPLLGIQPTHLEGVEVNLPQGGQLHDGRLPPAPHHISRLHGALEGADEEALEVAVSQLEGGGGIRGDTRAGIRTASGAHGMHNLAGADRCRQKC